MPSSYGGAAGCCAPPSRWPRRSTSACSTRCRQAARAVRRRPAVHRRRAAEDVADRPDSRSLCSSGCQSRRSLAWEGLALAALHSCRPELMPWPKVELTKTPVCRGVQPTLWRACDASQRFSSAAKIVGALGDCCGCCWLASSVSWPSAQTPGRSRACRRLRISSARRFSHPTGHRVGHGVGGDGCADHNLGNQADHRLAARAGRANRRRSGRRASSCWTGRRHRSVRCRGRCPARLRRCCAVASA